MDAGSWLDALRRWARRLVVLYALLVVSLWFLLRHVGEHHLTVAVLVYVPPGLWLALLLLLAPLALVAHDRVSLLAFGVGGFVVCFGLFHYRFADGVVDVSPDSFRFVTCNIGQRANASLRPFKDSIQPDVMVLQDAPGKAKRYQSAPDYKEFTTVDGIGEFVILSRHPVKQKALIQPQGVRQTRKRLKPLAARFELDVNGRPLAVYAVHLFTPRDALTGGWRAALLYGLIGFSGTPWHDDYLRVRRFWDDQLADIADLKAAISAETIPCIVAGDFNAPAVGRYFQDIANGLQDTHAVAGKGSGFTIPGRTRNPLSAFGPWLRIDAILVSKHFGVTGSQVEPPSPAQHLAVGASLQW